MVCKNTYLCVYFSSRESQSIYALISGFRAMHFPGILSAIHQTLRSLLDADHGTSHVLPIQDKFTPRTNQREFHWKAFFPVS